MRRWAGVLLVMLLSVGPPARAQSPNVEAKAVVDALVAAGCVARLHPQENRFVLTQRQRSPWALHPAPAFGECVQSTLAALRRSGFARVIHSPGGRSTEEPLGAQARGDRPLWTCEIKATLRAMEMACELLR